MIPKKNILVIGIGNRFRCDDGIGLLVVDDLQDNSDLQEVEFMKIKPDGYSLIQAWNNRPLVIIVDAAIAGGPTGTIRRFDALAERIPHHLSPLSSHSISLAETIRLADTLQQLPERLIVFAIEVGDMSYGQELSPEVEKAGIKVSKEIIELIKTETAGLEN